MAEILGVIVVITIGLRGREHRRDVYSRERYTEIAVMRSIGFTARTILLLLLAKVAADRAYRRCARMRCRLHRLQNFYRPGSLAAGPQTEVRISPLIFMPKHSWLRR